MPNPFTYFVFQLRNAFANLFRRNRGMNGMKTIVGVLFIILFIIKFYPDHFHLISVVRSWHSPEDATPFQDGSEGIPFPDLHLIDDSVHITPHITELPDYPPVRSKAHLRFLTVATLLRDERRWLREWIEFYTMMGTEHFIIYDHGSTDHPLEVLQYYIDQGIVTYIPWPPQNVPFPEPFKTRLEEAQYSRFKESVETCISDTVVFHRQAPCQMSAFSDAIRRTRGGVSRWLGIFDVDEYIFPRSTSPFGSLAEILRRQYADTDHLLIYGSNFGPSGHIEHAARRKPGSPLPALLTESYTLRPEHYAVCGDSSWGTTITKALADPDMISHSEIHWFESPANSNRSDWTEHTVTLDDEVWKFNHYSTLSYADLRLKAKKNRNPFLAGFTAELEECYSGVRDTEVLMYIGKLKSRMLDAIEQHPPPHPDDWSP